MTAKSKRTNVSKYKPEYCQGIIDFMANGYSKVAYAGFLGVSRTRLYDWVEKYPDFAEAFDIAHGKRLYSLEKGYFDAKDKVELTKHIFALKNADPTEWRDQHVIAGTGKDGALVIQISSDDDKL